jgi:hypothetical protein
VLFFTFKHALGLLLHACFLQSQGCFLLFAEENFLDSSYCRTEDHCSNNDK